MRVRTIKAKDKEKKKLGRKPKLIIEDPILMTLQYLREYRTYYHMESQIERPQKRPKQFYSGKQR